MEGAFGPEGHVEEQTGGGTGGRRRGETGLMWRNRTRVEKGRFARITFPAQRSHV